MKKERAYYVVYTAFDKETRAIEGTAQIKVPLESTYTLGTLFEHLNAGIEEKLRGKYPDYFEGYVIKIQNIIPVENILSYNFLSCKEEETTESKEAETNQDLLLIYKRLNELKEMECKNRDRTKDPEEKTYLSGVIYGIKMCIQQLEISISNKKK